MLKDYRDWLESELKLLGNASHHAYSFGQANMAKRALERLDAELSGALAVLVPRATAERILTALEMLQQRDTHLDPALADLRDRLTAAIAEGSNTM